MAENTQTSEQKAAAEKKAAEEKAAAEKAAAEKKAAEEKAAKEKAEAEKKAAEEKAAKEKASAKRKELTKAEQIKLMDKLKTDVLFKNHKGEYFASENLAGLSITAEEKKAGKKVAKLERHVLEGKTDNAK